MEFLPAKKFGQMLLSTGDLDPVYLALAGTIVDTSILARVCLAYWCCYALGASCRIAEQKNFWRALQVAAVNENLKWPRGAERRHWRGHTSIECSAHLAKHFGEPLDMVMWCAEGVTFQGVTQRVRQLPYFGPWIAFKVADMLERVFCYQIDFSDCALGFYDEPKQGAALYVHGDPKAPITAEGVGAAAEALRKELGPFTAPPWGDRPINIQEIETIFCKWKSHWKGHYWVGKDIKEVRHGLHGWGDLADQVLAAMPEEL